MKTQRRTPAIIKDPGVPMYSASAPKGTALKGIMPKVIMERLTIRPLISSDDFICIRVLLRAIKIELMKPTVKIHGRAVP